MRYFQAALAIATLCAVTPSMAQTALTKSIQLSKVVMNTEAGIKGKIKGGTLCVFPSKWKIDGETRTQDYERYEKLFADKMKAVGYTTFTTSQDMFATAEDANRGDFMIGATIRPDTINLCDSVAGRKGNATLAIDWQLYDRAARKVVLAETTTGYGVVEKFANNGLERMLDAAFTASLDALLQKGVLRQYLGEPGTPEVVAAPAVTEAAN
jgi:hypothetical protein